MKLFAYIFIAFVAFSCVTPFEYGIGNEKLLIIEGRLFEVDTSYIALRYSDQIYNSSTVLPVTDASVTVSENNSRAIQFFYHKGVRMYLPEDKKFRAKVGNTYQLKIVLNGGKTYVSEVDTLKSADRLSGITDIYDSNISNFVVSGELNPKSLGNSYYLFNFINYKKAKVCASCNNSQWYEKEDNNICGSLFKNCVNTSSQAYPAFLYGFECYGLTGRCLNYKRIREFLIYSDETLEQNTNRIVELIKIPLTTYDRYFLAIHQNRISKKAYQYFRLLEQAGIRAGTLFDPTPPQLVGNVYAENNPNDRAFGYFLVSGQQIYGYFVERAKASGGSIQPFDINIEFVENILTTARPFEGCLSSPVSNKCIVTDFRTDVTPIGWKDF